MHIFSYKIGTGKPVITLHGLYGSYENLGAIIRKLSPDYEVHAIDIRNHGRSFHTDVMNYQLMAEDIISYMNDNNLKKVDVIGHSMGGKIAMQLALCYPQRINSIAVIDIAPVAYTDNQNTHLILDSMLNVDLSKVHSRKDADLQLAQNIQNQAIRQFLLKNLYQKDNKSNYSWRLNLTAILANFNSILDKPSANDVFYGKTLFLKGGNSTYIKQKHFSLIQELFPNCNIKTIPDAGHWLHAEKPKLVLQYIMHHLLEVL